MGSYLSERAWGTVREDYSEHGTAWDSSPTTTRGPEPTAGTKTGWPASATNDRLSASRSALWNGNDPILKERMFGLGGDSGNHGEDVKEYWWYEDPTPTHSWMRWRYHYPQAAFPTTTRRGEPLRGRDDTEYELVDTGIFDDDRSGR